MSHEQKHYSNSNKSKNSSLSTDNTNKKSRAQHVDACVAIKDIFQNHLMRIVTF